MTADAFNLNRFVRAQAGIYPTALAELREGHKRTHWMWYVFPQMQGLGKSANARLYAITGREEAVAYCQHDLLGARLVEATEAMLLHAGTSTALDILGVIDALKFHSSMTLFEECCAAKEPFARALDAFYAGRRDTATLALV